MDLQRIEEHCKVTYTHTGKIVGVIEYKHPAPSDEALNILAKRILHVYKESITVSKQ